MTASRKVASRLARGRAAPKAQPDQARKDAANPWRAAGHAVQKRKTIQILEGPAEKACDYKSGAKLLTRHDHGPWSGKNKKPFFPDHRPKMKVKKKSTRVDYYM